MTPEELTKDLNELFSQIGPCYSKVKFNHVKRLPYGLVQFEVRSYLTLTCFCFAFHANPAQNPDNANKALEWHLTARLRGRPLRIEMCNGKSKFHPNPMTVL